jgi:hypothetical protein
MPGTTSAPTPSSEARAAEWGKAMPDKAERQRRVKTAILERVQDLASEENLALALIETGFDMIAADHLPAKLSAADRAAIRDNYADATREQIATRSVTEAGLVDAVCVAESLARVYIDYSPLSHWKADQRQDQELDAGMAEEAASLVKAMHGRWEAAGVSRFGVCCVLILSSAREALRRDLAWPKVVRILLDAIQTSYQHPAKAGAGPGLSEDESMHVLMEMTGISKAQARRYMAVAKAMQKS